MWLRGVRKASWRWWCLFDLEGQEGFEQVVMEVTILPRMWYPRTCHGPCAHPPSAWCEGQFYVSALQAQGCPGCMLFLGASVRVLLGGINLFFLILY